ncbi:MAG TPA: helix-turn-helix domain-containing protein [Acidimicrobiia bacterium]|nr:helix-turn-helix domain-containing protein [Acidimicrobiia bacterium]
MKTYGQFCGLARALDIVGDRWTLLVVRDLLAHDATFGELERGLPGIATNILTERLRHLEDHGIVWRRREGRQTIYGLTGRGRDLTDAIHALIRWGAPEMMRGVDNDLVRVEWLAVALGALTRPSTAGGRIRFRVDDRDVTVDLRTAEVSTDSAPDPDDVEIDTSVEGVLALMAGRASLRSLVRTGVARCRHLTRAERRLRMVLRAG